MTTERFQVGTKIPKHMRQVNLFKTNEGVKFWLRNDDDTTYYIRGEFALKERGYKAYKEGDRSKERIFPKDKKVWVKF